MWGGGGRKAGEGEGLRGEDSTLTLCKALDRRHLPQSTQQPHFMAQGRSWDGPGHPPQVSQEQGF